MKDPIPAAKDLIELPGPFTFKIFSQSETFSQKALAMAAGQVLGREVDVLEFRVATSRKGTYQAHTLSLHLDHFAEIEQLYQTFKALPGVVMML